MSGCLATGVGVFLLDGFLVRSGTTVVINCFIHHGMKQAIQFQSAIVVYSHFNSKTLLEIALITWFRVWRVIFQG